MKPSRIRLLVNIFINTSVYHVVGRVITMKKPVYNDTVSLVLCGETGPGIQTVEYLLARMFKQSGFHE